MSRRPNAKFNTNFAFQEQAKAMNMTALQFRKQLNAHLRRAVKEDRDKEEYYEPDWDCCKKSLRISQNHRSVFL